MRGFFVLVLWGIVVGLIFTVISFQRTYLVLRVETSELRAAQGQLTNKVAKLTARLDKLGTALVRERVAKNLMGRSVTGMSVDELVLLLRTARYEEAAEELGHRRAEALKRLNQAGDK